MGINIRNRGVCMEKYNEYKVLNYKSLKEKD